MANKNTGMIDLEAMATLCQLLKKCINDIEPELKDIKRIVKQDSDPSQVFGSAQTRMESVGTDLVRSFEEPLKSLEAVYKAAFKAAQSVGAVVDLTDESLAKSEDRMHQLLAKAKKQAEETKQAAKGKARG